MADRENVLIATEGFVKGRLPEEPTAHDWPHAFRVRKLALEIAEKEGADPFIVQLAALLHDIADHKFHGGDGKKGGEVAREWLESNKLDTESINHVVDIIDNVSFSKTNGKKSQHTIEGEVVQDADRLEAIGAVGIARAFVYAGQIGELIDGPDQDKTCVGHFHKKLLRLKDLMNTKTGKELAEDRHRFVIEYIKQLEKEWEI